jgi:glycosyltransferase involved in cell wall biosynthesis
MTAPAPTTRPKTAGSADGPARTVPAGSPVDPIAATVALQALDQRLRAVAPVLLPDGPPTPDEDVARNAAILLQALVNTVHRELAADQLWLLYVAVTGYFPTTDEFAEARRTFELVNATEVTLWLLDLTMAIRFETGLPLSPLRLVCDGVVVDVDHTAQNDLHTGIQQVVRRTLPFWSDNHDVALAAWNSKRSALRALDDTECERVLAWTTKPKTTAPADRDESDPTLAHLIVPEVVPRIREAYRPEDYPELVVPWRSTVALFEVPQPGVSDRLAALAQFSGNRLVAIGYDCIPVVSAESVPFDDRFPLYLSIIKYAHRVAGISVSATAEFQGFADMLATQGLPGPQVVECLLAAESVAAPKAEAIRVGDVPLILSVGSFEPRKNGLALLNAAERLWREGLRFELAFIGGSTWGEEFPRVLNELRSHGRPVSARRNVTEAELATTYRRARFTVFASLHEGYGLPVAESLAAGTPVITANYGSTQEIAASGGALTVNPRDDDALTAAIRSLLTDDDLLERLHTEISARPARSWAQYAAELWDSLIGVEHK